MQHTGSVALRTARLLLRPYADGDAAALYRNLLSDRAVMAHVNWPAARTPAGAETLLAAWLRVAGNERVYRWAVCAGDEVAGDIAVTQWNARDARCELGFCLCRRLWGQGLMAEALCAVTGHLFAIVGFHRIGLRHDADNPASGRVMQKAGYLYEGTLRGAMLRDDGTYADVVLYGVTRDRWRAP